MAVDTQVFSEDKMDVTSPLLQSRKKCLPNGA